MRNLLADLDTSSGQPILIWEHFGIRRSIAKETLTLFGSCQKKKAERPLLGCATFSRASFAESSRRTLHPSRPAMSRVETSIAIAARGPQGQSFKETGRVYKKLAKTPASNFETCGMACGIQRVYPKTCVSSWHAFQTRVIQKTSGCVMKRTRTPNKVSIQASSYRAKNRAAVARALRHKLGESELGEADGGTV